MTREDVIKGLEDSIFGFDGKVQGLHFEKWIESSKAALELLKAQEPVKTKHNNGVTHWYVSAECDVSVNPGDKYCHECGRRLVWDCRDFEEVEDDA